MSILSAISALFRRKPVLVRDYQVENDQADEIFELRRQLKELNDRVSVTTFVDGKWVAPCDTKRTMMDNTIQRTADSARHGSSVP
jgi:hypothetical protein